MTLSIQVLQPFYASAGLLPEFLELQSRVDDAGFAADYGIVPEVRRDLAQVDGAREALDRFERTVRARRSSIHAGEVSRLHGLLRDRGITILPEETPVEDVLRSLLNREHLVEGADLLFSSPHFGEIDLNRFNGGLAAFRGGEGQVSFLFGLAVLTGRSDHSIQRIPAKLRKIGGAKGQGWKVICTDWRRKERVRSLDG